MERQGPWEARGTSAARCLLPLILCTCILGCPAPDEVPLPQVDRLRVALPGVRLGMRYGDLRAERAGLGLLGNGTVWEDVEGLKVEYGFWPKEVNRPPPLSARLMAIEGRAQVRDTVALWFMWRRAVDRTEVNLGVEPNCLVLSKPRTTWVQADFAGRVRVSVAGVVWWAEDGQDFDAFVITRAALDEYESPEWDGMGIPEVDCGRVRASEDNQ